MRIDPGDTITLVRCARCGWRWWSHMHIPSSHEDAKGARCAGHLETAGVVVPGEQHPPSGDAATG